MIIKSPCKVGRWIGTTHDRGWRPTPYLSMQMVPSVRPKKKIKVLWSYKVVDVLIRTFVLVIMWSILRDTWNIQFIDFSCCFYLIIYDMWNTYVVKFVVHIISWECVLLIGWCMRLVWENAWVHIWASLRGLMLVWFFLSPPFFLGSHVLSLFSLFPLVAHGATLFSCFFFSRCCHTNVRKKWSS